MIPVDKLRAKSHGARKRAALLRWNAYEGLFESHRQFLRQKADYFMVRFEDLLYLRNFKGGNGQIAGDPTNHQKRLAIYSALLRKFAASWAMRKLRNLSDKEFNSFTADVLRFLEACREEHAAIKGFGPVRAIALLAVYFPELVPVLDVNVLAAANVNLAQGQPAHEKFPQLCRRCRSELLKDPALSLRQLDRKLYIKGVIKLRR